MLFNPEWSKDEYQKEMLRRSFMLEGVYQNNPNYEVASMILLNHQGLAEVDVIERLAILLEIDFGTASRIWARADLVSERINPMQRGVQYRSYDISIQQGRNKPSLRSIQAFSYSHGLRGGFGNRHSISRAQVDARVFSETGRSLFEFLQRELNVRIELITRLQMPLSTISLASTYAIKLNSGGCVPVFIAALEHDFSKKLFPSPHDQDVFCEQADVLGKPVIVLALQSLFLTDGSDVEVLSGYMRYQGKSYPIGLVPELLFDGVSINTLLDSGGVTRFPEQAIELCKLQEQYITGHFDKKLLATQFRKSGWRKQRVVTN